MEMIYYVIFHKKETSLFNCQQLLFLDLTSEKKLLKRLWEYLLKFRNEKNILFSTKIIVYNNNFVLPEKKGMLNNIPCHYKQRLIRILQFVGPE